MPGDRFRNESNSITREKHRLNEYEDATVLIYTLSEHVFHFSPDGATVGLTWDYNWLMVHSTRATGPSLHDRLITSLQPAVDTLVY